MPIEPENEFYITEKNAGPWLPTHIEGLDTLLRGGLLLPPGDSGLIILIKGKPGTGKTTLAIQLARGACCWSDQNGSVFMCNKLMKEQECIKGSDSSRVNQLIEEYKKKISQGKNPPIIYSNEQNFEEIKSLVRRFDKLDENSQSVGDMSNAEHTTNPSSNADSQNTNEIQEIKNILDALPCISLKNELNKSEKHICESGQFYLINIKRDITNKTLDLRVSSHNLTCNNAFTGKPSTSDWAMDVCTDIAKSPNENKSKMIIVDGLNLLSDNERRYFDVEQLVEKLREKSLVGVIVYEDEKGNHEAIDYLADMIIQLKAEEIESPVRYFQNQICITKSRYQQSVLGWHLYKIRNQNGFIVFPSIHFHTHRFGMLDQRLKESESPIIELERQNKCQNNPGNLCPLYTNNIEDLVISGKKCPGWEENICKQCKGIHFPLLACEACSNNPVTKYIIELHNNDNKSRDTNITQNNLKQKSLLEYFLGDIKDGSCSVVLGGRGTCKTYITMDFLRFASSHGHAGLLVSLFDNQSTIIKQRKEMCDFFCRNEDKCNNSEGCYQNFYLLHFRPGCLTTHEFFHYLDKSLSIERKNRRIERLAFWDLTQLEFRFPFLAADELFIPVLVDYLKNKWAITSVFMGGMRSKLTKCISSVADNVLYTWQDQYLVNPKKPEKGYAISVDRIEGKPEENRNYFISYKKNEINIDNFEKKIQMIDKLGFDNFLYASSVREKIWAMHGFDVQEKQNKPKKNMSFYLRRLSLKLRKR